MRDQFGVVPDGYTSYKREGYEARGVNSVRVRLKAASIYRGRLKISKTKKRLERSIFNRQKSTYQIFGLTFSDTLPVLPAVEKVIAFIHFGFCA